MTPEQKQAFHQVVTDFLAVQGSAVTTGRDTYGWQAADAYEVREHMEACEPDYSLSTWGDSSWSEWMGTFDDREYRQGIDLVLTCRCGAVSGRSVRYDGGYAALVRAITGGE